MTEGHGKWLWSTVRNRTSDVAVRLLGLWAARRANNRIVLPDQHALVEKWRAELDTEDKRVARAETIGRAYDSANDRGVRVEAKAIGLLQIAAIIAALVALVLTRRATLIAVPSMVSVLYLIAAMWGALEALRLRAQPQVLTADSVSDTGGLAETAAAAQGLEAGGLEASNFVVGAFRDVQYAGMAAFVALVLAVLGVGDASGSPSIAPKQTRTSPVTSTTRIEVIRPRTALHSVAWHVV